MVTTLGWGWAIALNLLMFAAIGALTVRVERRRDGGLIDEPQRAPHASPWLHGPWPLFVGAIALVLLNFATLALSGRPWGVTSAFALWGAKIFAALGIDVANWPYWAAHANAGALAAPVTHDVTTVMDIGIILGAMTSAALPGRYPPLWQLPPPSPLPPAPAPPIPR